MQISASGSQKNGARQTSDRTIGPVPSKLVTGLRSSSHGFRFEPKFGTGRRSTTTTPATLNVTLTGSYRATISSWNTYESELRLLVLSLPSPDLLFTHLMKRFYRYVLPLVAPTHTNLRCVHILTIPRLKLSSNMPNNRRYIWDRMKHRSQVVTIKRQSCTH